MSRSLKKGPYIAVSLEKKVLAMNESGKKNVVKTQSFNDIARLCWSYHCCSQRKQIHPCLCY